MGRPLDPRDPVRHPAKFPNAVMFKFGELHPGGCPTVLDPFAGTGRIHDLMPPEDWDTWGVELEPEWAELHPRTVVGDARALPFPDQTFDMIVTSPCYGNRMADQTLDRGGHYRNTYRMALGRPATEGSATTLQWGQRYRELHEDAWTDVTRVARAGAVFLLNVKDHVRNRKPVPVAAFHVQALVARGWSWMGAHQVEAGGYREGENGTNRFDFEWVHELRLIAY